MFSQYRLSGYIPVADIEDTAQCIKLSTFLLFVNMFSLMLWKEGLEFLWCYKDAALVLFCAWHAL